LAILGLPDSKAGQEASGLEKAHELAYLLLESAWRLVLLADAGELLEDVSEDWGQLVERLDEVVCVVMLAHAFKFWYLDWEAASMMPEVHHHTYLFQEVALRVATELVLYWGTCSLILAELVF